MEQLCLIGSNLTQPVVVAPVLEKPEGDALSSLEKHLEQVLQETNTHLPAHEQISHWFLVNEEWTPENNLITPTLKLRRQPIESRYEAQIRNAVTNDKVIQWLSTD